MLKLYKTIPNYSEITNWIDDNLVKNSLVSNNKWFEIDNLSIYLRISHRLINNVFVKTIDISSVSITSEEFISQGRFTKLLVHLENKYTNNYIYVENLLNNRLLLFFIRRGYTLQPIIEYNVPCVVKIPKSKLRYRLKSNQQYLWTSSNFEDSSKVKILPTTHPIFLNITEYIKDGEYSPCMNVKLYFSNGQIQTGWITIRFDNTIDIVNIESNDNFDLYNGQFNE